MAPPESAYQVENFDPPPDEELICSICHCVFCEPVQGACDHVFCKICLDKWLSIQKSCPVCRKRLLKSAIRPVAPIIKNMIMKLKLKCPNHTQGCLDQVTLENYEQHQKSCIYETVNCKYKKCRKELLRKDIAKHVSVCKYKLIRCKKDCCLLLPRNTIKNHKCLEELKKQLAEKRKLERKLRKQMNEQQNQLKCVQQELERLKAANDQLNDTFNSDISFTSDTSNTEFEETESSLESSDSSYISSELSDTISSSD